MKTFSTQRLLRGMLPVAMLAVMGAWQAPALARRLAWPGRHSLLIYLAHQPVLVALVWSASLLLR